MLRISAKQNLFLSKREGPFSGDLFKGLAIAFSLHLLLLFGLHIASPTSLDLLTPLPPVAVEIDLGTPEVRVLAPVQVTLSIMEQAAPPKWLEVPAPALSLVTQNFSQTTTHEADFSEIEKIKYEFLDDLEEDND
ncbi:MAG: hypothetical protein S4CHLAM2_17600 [Chlamydiales bacterium]|nr:hypothetical protein [Chlamydiales bacterium]